MLFGSQAATGIGIGIGEALTLERSHVNWNQEALLRVGGHWSGDCSPIGVRKDCPARSIRTGDSQRLLIEVQPR